MKTYPLSNLIREHGFDRFQEGLRSRFADYKYELTYCRPNEDAAMNLDFENSNKMGRMTVWEAVYCDLDVIEIETGRQIFWKNYLLAGEKEFHQLLDKIFLYFGDGKSLP